MAEVLPEAEAEGPKRKRRKKDLMMALEISRKMSPD
jgi:hypothetical protein